MQVSCEKARGWLVGRCDGADVAAPAVRILRCGYKKKCMTAIKRRRRFTTVGMGVDLMS